MKQFTRYITYLLITMLALGGCGKSAYDMYEEDPRIYFSKFQVNADSVNYSFAIKPDNLVTDTVYLLMRIMGSAVNKDREIKLRIADTSKAKEGYHYKLGALVMPANTYETKIPVILYRRPGLKDSTVSIDFTVDTSKDFKPGYDDMPSTIYKKPRLQYKVSVNDFLVKPLRWDCCVATVLGAYSQVKYRFLILASGKTTWDAALDTTPGLINNAAVTFRKALDDYEAINGPLIDENGVNVRSTLP